ncbi:hypothetical protein GGI26_006152 [Coemansia sp. RSA 1358]|nr:hypothetical protein GGI26_006152 [Coemansia sp. RSA 1358]
MGANTGRCYPNAPRSDMVSTKGDDVTTDTAEPFDFGKQTYSRQMAKVDTPQQIQGAPFVERLRCANVIHVRTLESHYIRVEPGCGSQQRCWEDELLTDDQDDRITHRQRTRTIKYVMSACEPSDDASGHATGEDMQGSDPSMPTQAMHGFNTDATYFVSGSFEEPHNTESGDSPRESNVDSISQPFYPRSALFMRQLLPESAWEPDEATQICHQCSRRFTLFLRRHHCRRCGLVFCDSCSQRRLLLAAPVTPTQSGYYAQQHQQRQNSVSDDNLPLVHQLYAGNSQAMCWRFREYRACDSCAETVDRLPVAGTESVALVAIESESSGAIENAYNIFREANLAADSRSALSTHQRSSSGVAIQGSGRRRQSSSSICACPICMRDWATVWGTMVRVPGEGWQEAQERHIRECIEDASAEMQGGEARRRQQSDARRSRSVQSRPDNLPQVEAAQASSFQSRRSIGFLSFFERTPQSSTEEPISIQQALANGLATGILNAYSPDSADGADSHSAGHPNNRAARSPMGVRYVAYKLNSDTPLLGQECPICFEDFEPGQRVARLNCLCTYHQWCISDWLQRTPACPVHYE